MKGKYQDQASYLVTSQQSHLIQSTTPVSTPTPASSVRSNRSQFFDATRPPRPLPNWTKFTRGNSSILSDIKDKPFFEKPRLMAPSTTRNKSKCYDFHNEFGHTTEECLSLRFYLERLARQGHLSHYLPTGAKMVETAPAKAKVVINMLVGGSNSMPSNSDLNKVLSLEGVPTHYNVITFNDVV